jgi:hypothetical protein
MISISLSALLGYGIPSLIIFLFYYYKVFNDSGRRDDEFFFSLFSTVITMGILVGFYLGAFKFIW